MRLNSIKLSLCGFLKKEIMHTPHRINDGCNPSHCLRRPMAATAAPKDAVDSAVFEEFACKLKFRNTLPAPEITPKLFTLPINVQKYAKFRFVSHERTEASGIDSFAMVDIAKACPTDLITSTIYADEDIFDRRNAAKLAPADEVLMHDSLDARPKGSRDATASLTIHVPRSHQEAAQRPEESADAHHNKTKVTQLADEKDVAAAIAETFTQAAHIVHPTDSSISAVSVHRLLPAQRECTFAQCNFDAAPAIASLLRPAGDMQTHYELFSAAVTKFHSLLKCFNFCIV